MIKNFYSKVNNGNTVSKCDATQHYVQEPPYLIKTNYLNEFRTSLEKAKVRANLGIADSQTLYWGNIQGDIAEATTLADYINSLMTFDYNAEKNFEAASDFSNVNTVRKAAITCLLYLSKFKGEGAEIEALGDDLKNIIYKLYGVYSLDKIAGSESGVLNEITKDLKGLKETIGTPTATLESVESAVSGVLKDIDTINETLGEINNLIQIADSDKDNPNALQILPDITETVTLTTTDEEGNEITQEVTVVTKKGGLYVKDLSLEISDLDYEINDPKGKLTILAGEVSGNAEKIKGNSDAITTINNTTVPSIKKEIENVDAKFSNYVTSKELGDISNIVKDNELTTTLSGYVKTDSTASLTGITSSKATIKIEKPLELPKGKAGDSRRYVNTKEDLLKIKPAEAWPGMEVIVVGSSTMYILKDYDDSKTAFEISDWKMADSLKIVVLDSFEEYEELEKTNKVQDDVYYYIKHKDIEFVEKPVRTDFETLEEYENALETWANSKNILGKLLVTGAWAADLEAKLKFKANASLLEAYNNRLAGYLQEVEELKEFFTSGENSEKFGSISNIISSIEAIYKLEGEEGSEVESGILINKYKELLEKIQEIFIPAAEGSEAKGILVNAQKDINDIKKDLYGDGDTKATFVTWAELSSDGTSGDEGLAEGETLFVKTSTYNSDKEEQEKALAVSFTTKDLTSTNLSTETFALDNTTISIQGNSLKIGNNLLASDSDLISKKLISFTTYSEYISWINDPSGIYNTQLSKDANYWDGWYFIVLDYEGTKPKREDFPEGDSGLTSYDKMLEEWEENTLINYKAANTLYQPKGSYCPSTVINEIWSGYRTENTYLRLSTILEDYIKKDDEELIKLKLDFSSLLKKFNKLIEQLNIDESSLEESSENPDEQTQESLP